MKFYLNNYENIRESKLVNYSVKLKIKIKIKSQTSFNDT